MDELAPSTPGPDEQAIADHPGFDKCEAAIALITDKGGHYITGRTYTVSTRWGKVLRARMIITGEGSSSAPIVTCWTGSGPGVGISLDFAVPDLNDFPAPTK